MGKLIYRDDAGDHDVFNPQPLAGAQPLAKTEPLQDALAAFEKRAGITARPDETFTDYLHRVALAKSPDAQARELDRKWEQFRKRYDHSPKETTMSTTDLAARRAHEQLEQKAVAVAKADTSLSKEQAFTKALRENPDLYELAKAHRPAAPPAAAPDRSHLVVDEVSVELRKAADTVQARDPSLTPEQAMTRALRENPDLYRRHQ